MNTSRHRIQILIGEIKSTRQIDPMLGSIVGHGVIFSPFRFPARISRQRTQGIEEWSGRESHLWNFNQCLISCHPMRLTENQGGRPNPIRHILRLRVQKDIRYVRQTTTKSLPYPALLADQFVYALKLCIAQRCLHIEWHVLESDLGIVISAWRPAMIAQELAPLIKRFVIQQQYPPFLRTPPPLLTPPQ